MKYINLKSTELEDSLASEHSSSLGMCQIFMACVEAATVLMESLKRRLYKWGLCSNSLLVAPVSYCGAGGKSFAGRRPGSIRNDPKL